MEYGESITIQRKGNQYGRTTREYRRVYGWWRCTLDPSHISYILPFGQRVLSADEIGILPAMGDDRPDV